MKEQKKSSKTESSDISKTVSPAQKLTDDGGPDAPPRGSALNIETALTFARKIKNTEQIEMAWMYVETVIEQLEEVSDKIKRQSKLNAH